MINTKEFYKQEILKAFPKAYDFFTLEGVVGISCKVPTINGFGFLAVALEKDGCTVATRFESKLVLSSVEETLKTINFGFAVVV